MKIEGDRDEAIRSWLRRNFPRATPVEQGMKVLEEAEELCQEYDADDPDQNRMLDEAGDVGIALTGWCKLHGYTLDEVIQRRWETVRHRTYRGGQRIFTGEVGEYTGSKAIKSDEVEER